MLIVSYEFLAFLLVLFILYYIIPGRAQWMLLLAVSILFYFMSGVKPFLFLLATTVSTYVLAGRIGRLSEEASAYVKSHDLTKEEKKSYKKGIKRKQWHILLLGLFFNFGILAVLKYTNFMIGNVNSLLHVFGKEEQIGFVGLLLPLGISYYTFQSMGYFIDVYRGKYQAEKSFGRFALFVSFFPQLIQGPISRFDDLKESLFSEHRFEWKQVSFGLQRILWGYFKKLVIADRIVAAVLAVSQDTETFQGIYVLIGALCYTVNLYADFTGGIDIVIGIAEVLGIRLKENFDRPFSSASLAEYWRRWHMTLMTWFREYIFYPTSVCGPVKKLSKAGKKLFGDGVGKRLPVYAASLLVWFITGIWHGANWNFVSWGMANCIVLLVSQECEPLYKRFHERFSIGNTAGWGIFASLRTLLLVSCLQMFEYYPNAGVTFSMFKSLFTSSSLGQLNGEGILALGLTMPEIIVVLIGILVMSAASLLGREKSVRERLSAYPAPVRALSVYLLFLIVLVFGVYGIGYDASQFIYNQF